MRGKVLVAMLLALAGLFVLHPAAAAEDYAFSYAWPTLPWHFDYPV